MRVFSRFAVMLTLGAAGVGFGQAARPSLVAVPLELDPNPSLTRFDAQLRGLFHTVLEERSGALLLSKKESEAAIKDTKRQDFRESDEGLARLAEKAGTLYGLYASLEFTPKKVLVLSGRVVRDDGRLIKSAQVQLPKGEDTIVDLMRPLTMQLIEQLGLAALPSFKQAVIPPVVAEVPPVKPVPDPVKIEPPPPPPLVVVDEGAGQRTAGRALVIGGGVAAVAGAVLLGAGQAVGAQLTPDGNRNLPLEQLPRYQTATGLSTSGIVALALGGVTAGAGAIVWALAPSAPTPVKVVLVPQPGGAMFSLQGEY